MTSRSALPTSRPSASPAGWAERYAWGPQWGPQAPFWGYWRSNPHGTATPTLMDTHLHLAPHVTPLFIEDGAVIEAEDGFQVTRDPALRAVLLVLATSPHSRAGLAAALPPNFDPASVHNAVATLIAEGILLELPAPLSPAAAALWRGTNTPPAEAAVAVSTVWIRYGTFFVRRTRKPTAIARRWLSWSSA